jgi:hypothetical protein
MGQSVGNDLILETAASSLDTDEHHPSIWTSLSLSAVRHGAVPIPRARGDATRNVGVAGAD